MLNAFVEFLFSDPSIHKIITESDPKNCRAKCCYKKVGFQEVGITETPDGPSVIFVIQLRAQNGIRLYREYFL